MWDHEIQWIGVVLRLFHVVLGVMWIGASFYIISWENKFNRTKGLREEVEGNFWTIQGGDFYYVEKLRNTPAQLPEKLHWFKYEAYLTWLSGFALLCLVFYFDAEAMLIDKNVADVSATQGVALGLGALLVSWLVYNLYCKTPLAKNLRVSAVVGLLFLALLGYFFSQVFSQRAAFIHVGAVMGTIMSANVFFVIIPWHRALIKAIENQRSLDELYACRPGFRSRHNHYMTLPVFFIMLSGHFPVAINQPHYWVVITAIALAAGLIKHHHNLVQQKVAGKSYLVAGIGIILGIVYATAPAMPSDASCREPITTEQAFAVIAANCRSCHSAEPTDKVWVIAPIGVTFDSSEQMLALKDRIVQRTVVQQDMPLTNQGHMRPEERQLLGCWAQQFQ